MKALAQLINTTANTAGDLIAHTGETISYTTFAMKVVAINYAEGAMQQLADDRKTRDTAVVTAMKAELNWPGK